MFLSITKYLRPSFLLSARTLSGFSNEFGFCPQMRKRWKDSSRRPRRRWNCSSSPSIAPTYLQLFRSKWVTRRLFLWKHASLVTNTILASGIKADSFKKMSDGVFLSSRLKWSMVSLSTICQKFKWAWRYELAFGASWKCILWDHIFIVASGTCLWSGYKVRLQL